MLLLIKSHPTMRIREYLALTWIQEELMGTLPFFKVKPLSLAFPIDKTQSKGSVTFFGMCFDKLRSDKVYIPVTGSSRLPYRDDVFMSDLYDLIWLRIVGNQDNLTQLSILNS